MSEKELNQKIKEIVDSIEKMPEFWRICILRVLKDEFREEFRLINNTDRTDRFEELDYYTSKLKEAQPQAKDFKEIDLSERKIRKR